LQSDWNAKYQLLQSTCEKKQAKMQTAYNQLEEHYAQLQNKVQQEQNTLHELSKQMAVGLNATAIEKILQSSPPTAYALATSSGGVIDDYQRLVNWIRDKSEQLSQFELNLSAQIQPLQPSYDLLHQQLADLIQLISASHWPQIRRYANAVQEIEQGVENLYSQMEHYVSNSNTVGTSIGLVKKQALLPKEEEWGKIPPRPLSEVYPALMTIAGSTENPQFMESMNELGTIPFLLDPEAVLVFTVYCHFPDFFRFDIFLGTRLRINTCQVRVIIRELQSKTPIRVLSLDALEMLDNRFHPISFEPIADSAGKTYQIEMDSPDANEISGIAVWCHPKQPSNDYAQQPDYERVQRIGEINELPQWIEQDLLDLPLPTQLDAKSAPHLFMVFGLTESTHILDLLLFLRKLGSRLEQANSKGQIVICGLFNAEVRQYCQQHLLTTLETEQAHIDLPVALNWGKNQNFAAEYLWCCEIHAIPEPNIIERAMEMLTDCPDAGLLVPMEKYADGKIRAGYASLMRDGVLETALAGAPADHPYYSYRRVVDAASSQLVIMKKECLPQINISEIGAYRIPMYQLTELIWQLKDKQYEAIYEAALCYEQNQPYPELPEQDYSQDCQRFYQRWGDKLSTRSAHWSNALNPLRQPTVLVIDATLPMYDEDSGSLRLYTLLKLWVSLGYRITFFPDNLDSQFKYRHSLEALGIEVFHGNYRIADAMAYRQFDFALICRVEIGQRYIPFVRLLSPKTVIFMTLWIFTIFVKNVKRRLKTILNC